MPTLVLFLFRFARLLFSGHAAVAVENAALRLQLAAFQRKRRPPVLTSFDRLSWVGLSLLWKRWRSPLIYVRADTVVRWQRERFRRFWARLETFPKRLKALEAKAAREHLILTEEGAGSGTGPGRQAGARRDRNRASGLSGSSGYLLRRHHQKYRTHLPADLHRHVRQSCLCQVVRPQECADSGPTC